MTTLYSTLTLPGADSGNASPPGSSVPAPVAPGTNGSALARRHFKDFTVDTSSHSGAAHAYLTLSENPLQPVVLGLTFTSLFLFVALVLSTLGFGRKRIRFAGEDKF